MDVKNLCTVNRYVMEDAVIKCQQLLIVPKETTTCLCTNEGH